MSERGSFITEYIYCIKCFNEVKKILLANDKYLCSRIIPSWVREGEELPIIAGKIGGLYSGEEIDVFEEEYRKEIAKVICHPMRVALLAEKGERIFKIYPTKNE